MILVMLCEYHMVTYVHMCTYVRILLVTPSHNSITVLNWKTVSDGANVLCGRVGEELSIQRCIGKR